MSAAELRARLAELDTEILEQTKRLVELRKSRMTVQTQLDSVLVYPILTLPVEITSEIFIHCLPFGTAPVMLSQAPFLLLKICRQWRDIALSTPKLWTTLNIDVVKLGRRVSRRSRRNWVDLTTSWLRRARGQPLSITLRHPPEEYESDMFELDLDFIRRVSSRIEYLEVHGLERTEDDHGDPLDPEPGSFPLLRHLVIGPAEGADLHDGLFGFFSDAPQLRELALLGDVEPSIVSLPWNELTAVTAYNFTLGNCLELLRLAPNLERCILGVQFTSVPPQSVTHLRLQSLSIVPDAEGDCWADILTSLTLPALQALDIAQITDFGASDFEAFLSRSSAPLRQLSVCPDRWYSWEDSSRLMPDLENLHLWCQDTEIQLAFMKALGESPLLPHLHHLTLHRLGPGYNEVAAAVAERMKLEGVDRLLSVQLLWAEHSCVPGWNVRFL